jgi:hypothetical protein
LIGSTSAFAPQGNVARCKFWEGYWRRATITASRLNDSPSSVTLVGRSNHI